MPKRRSQALKHYDGSAPARQAHWPAMVRRALRAVGRRGLKVVGERTRSGEIRSLMTFGPDALLLSAFLHLRSRTTAGTPCVRIPVALWPKLRRLPEVYVVLATLQRVRGAAPVVVAAQHELWRDGRLVLRIEVAEGASLESPPDSAMPSKRRSNGRPTRHAKTRDSERTLHSNRKSGARQ